MIDRGFEWALEQAKRDYPQHKWHLASTDYEFTQVLVCERPKEAIFLSKVGCNFYGPPMNANESDDREAWLTEKLAGAMKGHALHAAIANSEMKDGR